MIKTITTNPILTIYVMFAIIIVFIGVMTGYQNYNQSATRELVDQNVDLANKTDQIRLSLLEEIAQQQDVDKARTLALSAIRAAQIEDIERSQNQTAKILPDFLRTIDQVDKLATLQQSAKEDRMTMIKILDSNSKALDEIKQLLQNRTS